MMSIVKDQRQDPVTGVDIDVLGVQSARHNLPTNRQSMVAPYQYPILWSHRAIAVPASRRSRLPPKRPA